jgi:hypothetical protein
MAGAAQPTISLETSSSLNSYLICSTNAPDKAAFFIRVFTFFKVVVFSISRFNMAKLPFGTGTLMAF